MMRRLVQSRLALNGARPMSMRFTQVAMKQNSTIVNVQQRAFFDKVFGKNFGTRGAAELVVNKLNEGEGPTVPRGAKVKVHYTGKFPDGRVFDSSVTRGDPLEFKVGLGQVIKGWDEGIQQL